MATRLALAWMAVLLPLPDVAPNPVPRVGESLAPRKATAVEMNSEAVHIALEEDSARIQASFTLKNTSSEKEDLEVGFPAAAQPTRCTWSSQGGLNVQEWGPPTIKEFTAHVDGREVKSTPKQGIGKDAYNGWLCFDLSFAGGQGHDVQVSYLVSTRDDNYSEPSSLLNRQVTYILKTGAGWHGNIGEAVITLDMEGRTPDHILRTAPEATQKEKSSWTWKFVDFKPTADLLIQYRVFATAQEAIEKLSERLKANGADVEGWIDFADNLDATNQPLKAAEAFTHLHEMEKQEGHPLFRAHTEYQPPAYRAAKCYAEAGKKEESREWSKRAIARLEELDRKTSEIIIRKFLRTSHEAIRRRLSDCKSWAEE